MREVVAAVFLLGALIGAAPGADAGAAPAAVSDANTAAKTGGKMTLPPVEIRFVVRGVYEIFKSGGQVGREDVVRTTMSNNTVLYESVYQVMEGEGTAVTGNNKLEVEEDSGFPRSYYTYRRTEGAAGEAVREISVRMYANVASVSERQGTEESTRRIVLPAGCLFVEGNIAHHICLVLDRYDRDAGGKQVFRAFDPLGLGTTDVALEYQGEDEGKLSRYRYYAAGSFAADVVADAEGTVTRISATPNELEYVWKENRQ
jgi:hypothetical protein